MELHANAALSLNQRRRPARRVVDEEWSLAEAAKAAEVSERAAHDDNQARCCFSTNGRAARER
jgi:hypothetical protein